MKLAGRPPSSATQPSRQGVPEVFHRTTCRLCDGTDLVQVLSLAPTPPANAFVGPDLVGIEQPVLPLDVFFCEGCAHVQLGEVVSPTVLFEHYVYASGTSPVFVAHFQRYATDVTERFGIEAGDLVIEIGSNDGTLLGFFRDQGQRVLGIDPAQEIAERATLSGIPTLPTFFTPALADEILERHGPARLIVANNVFAHVDDLAGLVAGIRSLLATDGAFVFEVSYLLDVFEKALFDTIYHEHLDYHSVKPLIPFFARHGMRLVDVTRVDTHGGSLRGMVQRNEASASVEPRVADLVAQEEQLGLDRAETFVDFGARVDHVGRDLVELLRRLHAEGSRIAGFGAPAKATTLMHHFGIGPDLIEYIVDDSPLKQGLFAPGSHIPVLPSAVIYEDPPDYLLILAWNFAKAIVAAHGRFADGGGRFIVPLPHVEVI